MASSPGVHPAPWVLPHRDARRIGLVTVCLCRRAGARENRDRSCPANAGAGGVSQRRGASRFAPGGTPPARSRQASGPARRHFHSPGGSKGTVRRGCFVRRPSPSKRRGFAVCCIRNRSVPPVALLHRIFGSNSLFQGNAPCVFSDAATDMAFGSSGGFYLSIQSFRFFRQRLFPSS